MFLFYKNENDYEGELDEEGKMHGFGVITSKKTKIKIAATFFKDGIEGFGKCPKPCYLLFIIKANSSEGKWMAQSQSSGMVCHTAK